MNLFSRIVRDMTTYGTAYARGERAKIEAAQAVRGPLRAFKFGRRLPPGRLREADDAARAVKFHAEANLRQHCA